MAKLDYGKLKKQAIRNIDYSKDYSNQYDYKTVQTSWQNSLWPIKGKYYGIKLRNLPLSYLEWVGMNFNVHSSAYKLVVQELECRTNKT